MFFKFFCVDLLFIFVIKLPYLYSPDCVCFVFCSCYSLVHLLCTLISNCFFTRLYLCIFLCNSGMRQHCLGCGGGKQLLYACVFHLAICLIFPGAVCHSCIPLPHAAQEETYTNKAEINFTCMLQWPFLCIVETGNHVLSKLLSFENSHDTYVLYYIIYIAVNFKKLRLADI